MEIVVGHELTVGDASVTFEEFEVDLDYAEIQDNLDLSNYVEVSDLVTIIQDNLDLSDYVEVSDLQHQIDYYMPDIHDNCIKVIKDSLSEFLDTSEPCSFGGQFIDAVQKAMMWNGEKFEALPSSASAARTDLRHEIRAVLAEMIVTSRAC